MPPLTPRSSPRFHHRKATSEYDRDEYFDSKEIPHQTYPALDTRGLSHQSREKSVSFERDVAGIPLLATRYSPRLHHRKAIPEYDHEEYFDGEEYYDHDEYCEGEEYLDSEEILDQTYPGLDRGLSCHPTEKTVSFETVVEVQEVRHISDLSQEEIDSIWYTDTEMREIMGRAKKLVRRLRHNYPCADGDCKRGLENHLSTQQASRSRKALLAVLEAQENLWHHGYGPCDYAEYAIAESYRHVTFECKQDARSIALYDAIEVYPTESWIEVVNFEAGET